MIYYGGSNDTERLFLNNKVFISGYNEELIRIRKTNIPNINMEDLIVRHKARYGLVTLFCRPGLKLLDIPCGSGYASKLLSEYKVKYIGAEINKHIVEYANLEYLKYGDFILNDLTNIIIPYNYKFDIIACIEGIEHIGRDNQYRAMEKFYNLLNPNGVLIISMPEAKEKSGLNLNKFHLWERSKWDFIKLLNVYFQNIQILEQENTLSTGEVQNCLYSICRKEK